MCLRIWAAILLLQVAPAGRGAESTPLVNHGDAWFYRRGTNAPQADWKTVADAGLDATWAQGAGGLGYADNTAELAQVKTTLGDMKGKYTTACLRRTFEAAAGGDTNLHLLLTMDWDDGFIAWLDGSYLASANVAGAPAQPANTATASASHESSRGNNSPSPAVTYDLGKVGARLGAGPHVLAIMGLNDSSGSSDFIQIADLFLASVTNGLSGSNTLSGTVSEDTTLSATNSPYTLTADVTVASGATLAIEPGTIVRLASGVDLTVASGGRLVAEGTEQARILFTTAPGAAAWGGIVINGGAGTPETRIAWATIEGNGSAGIEVQGGTLWLDHAVFNTTTHQYVSLDGSSFLISHCHFPTTTAGFELLHGTGGIKAGGRGIVRDSFFGGTSGYNDIMDFTGGNRDLNQPIIQFYNNVFVAASDDILDLDGTDAWIEGNIFLHCHRNGAPDSSAAISGGSDGTRTSEITIIGNLIYDCDNAITAKQGNFYTLLNNTMVHMTKTGGLDFASGVLNLRDTTPDLTAFGKGCYLEGNLIADVEQLVRNYDAQQMTVTFNRNLLPEAWNGPGSGNLIQNPQFKHWPQLSETYFTNWADAQIMREWFSLPPGSPARGAGPNGQDLGGVVPVGVSLSGAPAGATTNTGASLTVGGNWSGSGIPAAGFPAGSGFTHYRWRLDALPWSAETPITTPILLAGLADGAHRVEVSGRNDAGFYQDDPQLGTNPVASATWLVQSPFRLRPAGSAAGRISFSFPAAAGSTYTVQYQESLSATHWIKLLDIPAQSAAGDYPVQDPAPAGTARFYRVVTPAQP